MKGWFFRLSRHPIHIHATERRTSLRAIKTPLWPSLTEPSSFLQSTWRNRNFRRRLIDTRGRNDPSCTLVPRTKNSSLTMDGAIRARVSGRLAIGMRRRVTTHTRASRYKHLHVSPPARAREILLFHFFTMHVTSCASSCLYETQGRTQWIKMSRDARIEWSSPCGRFVPHRRNSASSPDIFLAPHSRTAAGCDARASN